MLPVNAPSARPLDRRVGRGRLPAVFGYAISVVALTGCVLWALDQPAPSLPTSSRSLALLGCCLFVLAASMLLRGFRWSVILAHAGIHCRPGDPYALTLVGYMGNTVLPFRGGEALRVVLLKSSSDSSWANAIGSIVPERVLDLATLVVLLGALVLGGVIETPGGIAPPLVGIAGLVAAVGCIVVYRALRRRGRLQSLADRIRPLANASRPLLTTAGAWLALLSLVIWAVDGAIFYLVAESLSLSVSPLESLGLAVTAAAFSAIPAGPAYAGTYDAALLFALAALDVPPGDAVSFVILVRFVTFVPVTIAGLVALVARYGGLARLRRRESVVEAV